jgi:hypothetical protein
VCRTGIERTHVDGADEDVPKFMVTIKTQHSKTYELTASSTDTIWDLKDQIWHEAGMPHDQHRLVFEGTVLEDDGGTLAYYNIDGSKHLYSFTRIRGGDLNLGRFQ